MKNPTLKAGRWNGSLLAALATPMILTTSLTIAMSLEGCLPHYGEVAMQLDEREAHVGLGKDEVKPGDRVVFYSRECPEITIPSLSDPATPPCHRAYAGEGVVVRVLGSEYSVVRADPGVRLEEGMLVEAKAAH